MTARRVRAEAWLSLAVAAIAGFSHEGRYVVPLAVWLAPTFMLRFLSLQPRLRGFLIFCAVSYPAFVIGARGLIPLPDLQFYIVGVVGVATAYLPYLFHLWVAQRLTGFVRTLVFPSALVTLEYLSSFGEFGTWGSSAYSQYGNLTLMQLASVTGIWGISFLISWSASTANWLWERRFTWSDVRRGVQIYVACVALVVIYAHGRLFALLPEKDAIQVAGIATGDKLIDADTSGLISEWVENKAMLPEELARLRKLLQRRVDSQFSRSAVQAQAGAKFIFWAEANALSLLPDESALIERAQGFARQHRVYLGLAVGTIRQQPPPFIENKVVLVDPEGRTVSEYQKSIVVPGEPSIVGPGIIPITATPFGRIATIICFDADFPSHVRKAADADILFVPSNDWQKAAEPHMAMAAFRSVEQGVSIVRPTSNGISAAFDALGRERARVNSFALRGAGSQGPVLSAVVPMRGVWTLYSVLGDWLAWFCIIGCIVLPAVSYRRRLVHVSRAPA